MKQKKPSANDLRSKAEEALNSVEDSSDECSGQDVRQLIHELQIHQIELEMQNEELRSAQAEIEESRSRYADLYDFAPVGYLTFDKQGLIVEANLTAAKQLSTERAILLKKPFFLYLLEGDRDAFRLHLAQVFKTRERQTGEVKLNPGKSQGFLARLDSILIEDSSGDGVVRTSISDISSSRHAEEALKQAHRELEERVAERTTQLSTANEQLRREMEERKRVDQALAESRAQLFAVVDSTNDLIWSVDQINFGVVTWNRALEDYFLKSRGIELLVGMTPEQLVPPEFVTTWKEFYLRALRDGSYTTEYCVASGTIILLLSFNLLKRDGEVFGISVFGKDITERKKAEDALKQSEERYRNLMETSADWIWEVDANAKYTYADPKVQKILGYTPEEVIGRTPFELMPEEESHRIEAAFAEISADRLQFSGLINVNLHRDGREVVLETSGVPIYGPNGVFLGYRGVGRDVTERILAEKVLRESEERFRFMVEATGDVIYRLHYDTMTYDYLSPGIGRLTGYSPEEIKTIGFSSLVTRIDLLGQEDVPTKAIVEDRLAGKTGEYRADYLITTKTRTSKWLRDHSFPWYDDSGKNIGSVGILSDSTDYKHAEEILRERTAELSISNKALIEYAAKLERLNEELEDFAFVAAHDLQEPLRKIHTYCDMAQKRCASTLDSAGQEYLDRVISSASRMRQLLRDLLQFSLVVTSSEPFKVIDLDRIVREAADLFEEDLKKSGGLIEIEAMPAVEADEIQILRLFQNLIGNALKFRSAQPPQIVIYAKLNGLGICEIFVKDNGLGFEYQFAERIFKPFQRLHKRNKYEGTGIGLTICRKIAERHGGSIRVESEPGKGSTFIITLPVKQNT